MRLLLDTHALLWWLAREHLVEAVKDRIADPGTDVLVSAVCCWEVAIKQAAGKLVPPEPVSRAVRAGGFEPLPITLEHGERAGSLPRHHGDPFDRMLVAQAQLEGLTLVTRDRVFDAYDVALLRC